MPITHEFEYFKPKTLDEVLELKSSFGNDAKVLAGGTDLVNALKEGLSTPKVVIDIKGLSDFSKIQKMDGFINIGANVTFSEIIESKITKKVLPLIVEASKTVASIGTRNRATMLGNICSAVPSADAATPLLVLESKIWVMSKKGEREIDIKDWFTAPKKTALANDEIALFIHIPIPEDGVKTNYSKLGRYKGEDLAQANISVLKLKNGSFRVACGAVGPIPKRVFKTEKTLSRDISINQKIKDALNTVSSEISPITDIRCSKEYRYHMIGVMLERAVREIEGEKNK